MFNKSNFNSVPTLPKWSKPILPARVLLIVPKAIPSLNLKIKDTWLASSRNSGLFKTKLKY